MNDDAQNRTQPLPKNLIGKNDLISKESDDYCNKRDKKKGVGQRDHEDLKKNRTSE